MTCLPGAEVEAGRQGSLAEPRCRGALADAAWPLAVWTALVRIAVTSGNAEVSATAIDSRGGCTARVLLLGPFRASAAHVAPRTRRTPLAARKTYQVLGSWTSGKAPAPVLPVPPPPEAMRSPARWVPAAEISVSSSRRSQVGQATGGL